nr:MAG TPA_asm: hypothetical protein [Caudoviricetes sp.]
MMGHVWDIKRPQTACKRTNTCISSAASIC